MSDMKFCDSCGTSLSADAMFCHNCGKKQAAVVESEIPATDESNIQEPISATSINIAEPEKSEDAVEYEPSSSEAQPEHKDEDTNGEDNMDNSSNDSEGNNENELMQAEGISQTEDQSEKIILTEPVITVQNDYQQVEESVEPQLKDTYQSQSQSQPQPVYQQTYVTQQTPNAQQTSAAQQAPYVQQAPAAQQAPYVHQAPAAPQAAPVQTPKKKKFPWFFTVLWLIMFAAVGIWGYFLLVDPNYKYPIFTSEAQRYVLFTVAVAVLIYTLSLKLSMKKLKVIPTILMVLFGVLIFILFCMVELKDGNFLHDMVSNLVESVIPAFGE